MKALFLTLLVFLFIIALIVLSSLIGFWPFGLVVGGIFLVSLIIVERTKKYNPDFVILYIKFIVYAIIAIITIGKLNTNNWEYKDNLEVTFIFIISIIESIHNGISWSLLVKNLK